ncbi:MAG: hypothetical protein H6858_07250 [Rhodospirillales bacterium]|nr:hypothetical protein [Alphaproteobacteria bacterium]MCB1840583.1 hypothetical protein [Alphaproteobacteria bacterium]MCB9977377.1 hypothetical protein [Rhodospirillales bacterium]
MEFLQEPEPWIICSFLIVAYILWHFGRSGILQYLDSRIEQIRKELESAETLRKEAQELLSQYKRKQADAEKEAQRIVENAKKSSEQLLKQAETELEETIARREKQLADRLKRMQLDAEQEISEYASRLTIQAAKEIISEKLDKSGYEALLEKSITNVGQHGKTLN